MVEVRGVGLPLNLVGPQPQEIDVLLVQNLTLLISRQSMAVALQCLRGGQGGHTAAAAALCHWGGSSWPCTVPARKTSSKSCTTKGLSLQCLSLSEVNHLVH